MQIVVIGGGDVGEALIIAISKEGHNVTVIDEDTAVIDTIVNKYDVRGVAGNGANIAVQKEAGVEDCDVLIAIAPGDELNLLCCMIGNQLGAKHSIARVRNPEYLRQMSFMGNKFGIDMIVNPEYEAASEAARLIRFPAAMKLDKFAQGRVEVVEIHITPLHPLVGQKLSELKSKYSTNVLVCAARRGEDVIIPGGDYIISEGDFISVTASRPDITDFFMKIGLLGKHIKSVFIVGGGRITRYLATQLTNSAYNVKIIESNFDICEDLSDLLPRATIIHGNAADPDLLIEEGIDRAGACVAMTDDDKTNIIISMFAKTRSVEKIISKLSSESFLKLSYSSGIDSNISPKLLVTTKVIQYLRGLANRDEHGSKSKLKTLYKIADNRIEALEFDVAEDFKHIGIPLRNIKLKKNLLVAAVIRDGAVIYPHGQTVLEVGDSVIVVTTNEQLYDLGDILT